MVHMLEVHRAIIGIVTLVLITLIELKSSEAISKTKVKILKNALIYLRLQSIELPSPLVILSQGQVLTVIILSQGQMLTDVVRLNHKEIEVP